MCRTVRGGGEGAGRAQDGKVGMEKHAARVSLSSLHSRVPGRRWDASFRPARQSKLTRTSCCYSLPRPSHFKRLTRFEIRHNFLALTDRRRGYSSPLLSSPLLSSPLQIMAGEWELCGDRFYERAELYRPTWGGVGVEDMR